MRAILALAFLAMTLSAATFKLKLEKSEVYLNEPIVAKFILEYNSSNKPRYIKFDEFSQRGIEGKFISKIERKVQNKTLIEYNYLLFVEDANIKYIAKQELKLAHREPKTSMIIWKSLYSNSQNIAVKPIVKGAEVVGNLSLDLNSTKSKKGIIKAVININGKANLDDIEPFNLDIKDVTIYKSKPKIEYNITNGKLNANYQESFTIIANRDFIIPAVELTYFNSDTQMLEHLKSRAIEVKVANKEATKNRWLYFAIGLLCGVALLFLILFLKSTKRVDIALKNRVKLALTQKELYKILLPYSSEYDLDDILRKLESNIYRNSNNKVSKKEIIKAIEQNQ